MIDIADVLPDGWPLQLPVHALINGAPDGILVVDPDGCIHFANATLADVCGHTPDALRGQRIDILMSPAVRQRHQGHVHKYFANAYTRTMGELGRLRLLHRDGHEVPVDISLSACRAETGQAYAVLFVRDATDANAQRNLLEQWAMYDPLTGLYNRSMFLDQLGLAMNHAVCAGQSIAVCLVDLDNFKSVNEGYGHVCGDDLLKATALRLKDGLRAGDVLARLGGDEFAVLLRDLSTSDDAVKVARQILCQLRQPLTMANGIAYPGASVGVAYGPDDAQDAETLMRYVDMALYKAKEAGRGTYAVYAPAMAHQLAENIKLHERLKHALENNLLALHYQPQVCIGGSGGILSVEALLRWYDPELGHIPPDRFIAVAESTGLILPLGDWVLDTACRQLAIWREQGLVVQVGVNVSAHQFKHAGLALQVQQVLQRHTIPPSLLELEVTETAAMCDPDQAAVTLNQLAALGVGVALDDFGRGHSSLLYLLQLPVSRLKIDKMFISDIPDSTDHAKLTQAIIGLARTLGKAVVAEGVETQAQLDFLQREGCGYCQGWLFSKAVPPEHLPAVLARLQADPLQ